MSNSRFALSICLSKFLVSKVGGANFFRCLVSLVSSKLICSIFCLSLSRSSCSFVVSIGLILTGVDGTGGVGLVLDEFSASLAILSVAKLSLISSGLSGVKAVTTPASRYDLDLWCLCVYFCNTSSWLISFFLFNSAVALFLIDSLSSGVLAS